MMDGRAILVDSNVLLSATAPLRSLHRAASVVLNEWPNQGISLAASPQVFREYLVGDFLRFSSEVEIIDLSTLGTG